MPHSITYIRGDALDPKTKPAVIVHVVNDAHLWGKGFVVPLSKKWAKPEYVYRRSGELQLGHCQNVDLEDGVTVINMIAQHGIYSPGHRAHQNQPLVYAALYRCLKVAAAYAKQDGADLHMPKIGAGLAKGDWNIIESIINSVCAEFKVNAYVYIL